MEGEAMGLKLCRSPTQGETIPCSVSTDSVGRIALDITIAATAAHSISNRILSYSGWLTTALHVIQPAAQSV